MRKGWHYNIFTRPAENKVKGMNSLTAEGGDNLPETNLAEQRS